MCFVANISFLCCYQLLLSLSHHLLPFSSLPHLHLHCVIQSVTKVTVQEPKTSFYRIITRFYVIVTCAQACNIHIGMYVHSRMKLPGTVSDCLMCYWLLFVANCFYLLTLIMYSYISLLIIVHYNYTGAIVINNFFHCDGWW